MTEKNKIINQLIALSPDLYTRYFLVFKIIESVFGKKEIEILDAGGKEGLLGRFIKEKGYPYKLTILDILPPDRKKKNYVQGDICKAPFGDKKFDVVTSCDLLEHIKYKDRSKAILEMLRVSKNLVILTAPFSSKEVKKAEGLANDFFQKYTGKGHPWLKEHFKVELPEGKWLEGLLKKRGCYFQDFGSNNLSNWLFFILPNFMPSFFQVDIAKLQEFNRFYNLNFKKLGDFDPPTYRKIYIIGKDKSKISDLLKAGGIFHSELDVTKKLAFEKKVFDFIGNELKRKTSEISQKDQQLASFSAQVSAFQEQLAQKEKEIALLNNRIGDFQQKLVGEEQEIVGLSSRVDELRNIAEAIQNKLEKKIMNIHKLKNKLKEKEKEIQQKEEEINRMNIHIKDFQRILDNITSAKTFKIWQAYCRIRKKILGNPLVIFKGIKILITKGPKGLIQKLKIIDEREQRIVDLNVQYQIWLKKHAPTKEELEKQKELSKKFKYRPKISIITPVYDPKEKWLRACIESVLNQTYDNWEFCIADDASTKPYVKKVLEEYKKQDKRIKVVYRKKNGHICRASNSALKLATGEFIALLDHDDGIAPHALYEVVKLLNKHKDADFIYSDEDKLEIDGTRVDPFFKPDWSPDMFLSTNYLCHLSVIRKKLVDRVGGFRPGYEGSQDYDLFLRVTEKTDKIYHIPDVLYSWRKVPRSTAAVYEVKDYANRASLKALSDAIKRRKLKATVENGLTPGTFRVKYKFVGNPLVSIIIPTKDKVDYLKKCIESVLEKTNYKNYEILIVDTGSKEKKTFAFYKKLRDNKNIKFLKWNKAFSFAAVNNFAVKKARGKYVLFLNNDTEVIALGWLSAMLEHAQRKEVGAVGAKLLYPDERIQHAGIILGIMGVANHASLNMDDRACQWFPVSNSKDMIRDFSAVTAACLMISKKKYLKAGGMNEKFKIAFNDVDFCLRLTQKGYFNVYTPYAKLYHYESVSVGKPEWGNRDIKEFHKEVEMMHKKWSDLLQNDPYYNPNLTLDKEDFSLKI